MVREQFASYYNLFVLIKHFPPKDSLKKNELHDRDRIELFKYSKLAINFWKVVQFIANMNFSLNIRIMTRPFYEYFPEYICTPKM